MILLLWLHFCMSMVFYGAEINYFLENKKNYHTLIRTFRRTTKPSAGRGRRKCTSGAEKTGKNRVNYVSDG